MFTEVIKLIENRKLDDAVDALLPLYNDENPQTSAYAGYLLGYINTRYDYKAKRPVEARKYLKENISGPYPHPYAYVLYSRIEEDPNIGLNHLTKGLDRFPKDARILQELLEQSPDKESVVKLIKDSDLDTPELIGKAIAYLIKAKQWDQIGSFVFLLEKSDKIDEDERLYLELIKAFALIFQNKPNYKSAQDILETIIASDTNNQFAYAHYLGLVFSLIKQGSLEQAITFFDRLPINNSIMDFDDGPWPLGLYINFEEVYKNIFDTIVNIFHHDNSRKQKHRPCTHYIYTILHKYMICIVIRNLMLRHWHVP